MGVRELDENWWEGELNSNTGIFPLTCVRELLLDCAPRRKSFRSNTQTSCTIEPATSPPVHISDPVIARALVDVTPQLDGELGFSQGDLITIKKVIDSDWFFGEAGNQEGLVSSVCVDILEDIGESDKTVVADAGHLSLSNGSSVHESSVSQTNIAHPSSVYSNSAHTNSDDDSSRLRSLSYTSENTRSHDAEVTPYARVLYTFVGQNDDELSINEYDIVTLIQHVDPDWIEGEADGKIGLFPAAYVEIIVDCPYAYNHEETAVISHDVFEQTVSQASTDLKSEVYESSLSSSLEIEAAAISSTASTTTSNSTNKSTAICDNHLPSKPGGDKTVVLDPASGLSTTSDSDSCSAGTAGASDILPHPGSVFLGQRFGLVLHNFTSQVAGDLSVQEGDTVTILQTLDAHWIQAQDDHGRVGIVPLNHIEVIGEGPPHVPNEKQDFSIASRPAGTATGSSPAVTQTVKGAQDTGEKFLQLNHDSHQVVNSICDNKSVSSIRVHPGDVPTIRDATGAKQPDGTEISDGTKHLDKPKLKPKPLPKPKLAPKPVIKPKPNLYSAQPFAKPPDMSTGLHVGHVTSPTEHKTFVGINSAKSLNTLIEDQLEIAKSEAKMRSRNSSVKSSDSYGSRDSDISSKDGAASGMSDVCGTCVPSINKLSLDVPKRESPTANGSGDASSDSSISLGQSNWVSFDACEAGSRTSVTGAVQTNTTQPVSQSQGSMALTSDSGIHSSSSFINDGYVQDHFHEPTLVEVNHSPSHNATAVLRPPPPVPYQRLNSVEEAYKQPIKMPPVRKAPPPRPTGPKIAPAPSKTVLQPTKVTHPLPQRPAPPVPKGASVKHPAPPRPTLSSPPRRPQPRPVSRTISNDLMSFSPEKEGECSLKK